MKIILTITICLFISGCGLECFDAGQRSCDGFLCLHPICNGQPLTPAEIKAGVKP